MTELNVYNIGENIKRIQRRQKDGECDEVEVSRFTKKFRGSKPKGGRRIENMRSSPRVKLEQMPCCFACAVM